MTPTFLSAASRLKPTILLLSGLAVAGCGLDKQTAPSFMGPSGPALSLSMTASPDVLRRDGLSRSTITILARGIQGEALSGKRFFLTVTSTPDAGGALSVQEVTTGSDGRATFDFTAPEADVDATLATVFAEPVGEDFGSAQGQSVRIRLAGPAFPTPSFTFSPTSFGPGVAVRFDASATTVDGAACGAACQYRWEFNDEATLEGQVVEYAFQNDGFYNVALTVYSLKHNTQKKVTQRIQVGLP